MAPEPTDRERNLQALARAHRVYLTSGAIFRPTAELWIDKLTDEMMRTEAPLELPVGRRSG